MDAEDSKFLTRVEEQEELDRSMTSALDTKVVAHES
jgi:hypothetical protein